MAAPPQRPRRKTLADEQSRAWFRVGVLLVGALLRFWVRKYRALGVENVPPSGGFFLICNHTSALDPFLLGYPLWRRMPSGPGKVELFSHPVFAYAMRKLGIFPLRQDRSDTRAVKAMIELYRHERIVIVYPEGGRSDSGELTPFVPDFARLMLRLKAVVVPAAIAGANEVLPIGAMIPRRNCPAVVVFGQPLDLSSYLARELTEEVVAEAASWMQQQVADLQVQARRERASMLP